MYVHVRTYVLVFRLRAHARKGHVHRAQRIAPHSLYTIDRRNTQRIHINIYATCVSISLLCCTQGMHQLGKVDGYASTRVIRHRAFYAVLYQGTHNDDHDDDDAHIKRTHVQN